MSSAYWMSSNWQNIQLYCFMTARLMATVAIGKGTFQ